MPARKGDCRSRGSVEVTQFQRSVFKYAAKRAGGSNPRSANRAQFSALRISASSSFSQRTSSDWPCASSSMHERLTRVASNMDDLAEGGDGGNVH
jgi:hypothetical protein